MIKIIFCDMDGTLLTSESKLPDNFDEMIDILESRGVTFAPSSGRQYFSLMKSFPKYADDFLFLGDNGTLVMYKGKEIFSSPMEESAVKEVLQVAENLDKNILKVMAGKKYAHILKSQDSDKLKAELDKYYTRSQVTETWDEVDDVPIKLSFCDKTFHAEKNVYPYFEKFKDKLQVVLASSQWVDITSQNVNKGAAIKNIQRGWNIKPEECAAFGDFMNDYEMLQAVEHSFAMANAYPEIKKVAKYETLSNDNFGVYAGIKKLIAEGLI